MKEYNKPLLIIEEFSITDVILSSGLNVVHDVFDFGESSDEIF